MLHRFRWLPFVSICLYLLFTPVFAQSPPDGENTAIKPVIILADMSGSMLKKMESYGVRDGDTLSNEEERIRKSETLKELLLRMTRELLPMQCEFGVYRVRYIAGNRTVYTPFLEIDAYDDAEAVAETITDDFKTDYPIFNRRTPLADIFRQLDERLLEDIDGRATLVLLSDGRESFYDLDDDAEKSRENYDPDASQESDDQKRREPSSIDEDGGGKDDKPVGPLNEIERLKRKYGENIDVHFIYVGDSDVETREEAPEVDAFYRQKRDGKEAKGENLMHRMSYLGRGDYYRAKYLLENPVALTEFCDGLCGGAAVADRTPVAAVPVGPIATIVPADKERRDADQDGIYDDEDQCPGSPLTAPVNIGGCWILPTVYFDTDKSFIKPEFRAELDEVARVLAANPETQVELHGHTDIRATAEYNVGLSERRARAVRNYLTARGAREDQLILKWFGLTQPTAPNDTVEGMARNRRTELILVR